MANLLKRLFSGEADARRPQFAGHMYPDDADELESLLDAALERQSAAGPWRAAIVAHSDVVLTADLHASVWCDAPDVDVFVVVAPALRVPFRGVGVSSKLAFETPLGSVRVDHDDYRPLEGSSVVRVQDEAHRVEPGIELQLPWIRHVRPGARIVPVLVGDGPAEDVAWALDRLFDDDAALILACELSTDLSAAEAEVHDQETVERIVDLDTTSFGFGDVSARKPLQALLTLARERGLEAACRTSTHTGALGGPDGRVQGLGAFTLST